MSAFCEMVLTMKVIKALVFVLIGVQRAASSGPFVQEALAKVFGHWTPYSNVRTIQLLNQLCNESQKDDEVRTDACYGCFFRSSNQPPGYPMLLTMASCADTYLDNTDYGHCQSYLRNATNSISTRTSPGVIYCSFLECIRQVNKNMLEANEVAPPIDQRRLQARGTSSVLTASNNNEHHSHYFASFHFSRRNLQRRKSICVIVDGRKSDGNTIAQCVNEAKAMFSNFKCADFQLTQLFVNATVCVLAKTRCSYLNPITGITQENELANKLNIVSINALQVNTDYDLNIIRVPFVNPAQGDECGKFRNVDQASWPSAEC
ncbi:uncharacterized protein LOC124306727 isoform X1 [Neodiprion virginianus]|uniref:uncharacterized protein LOC124306727 isoform X1 n=1 Tax=Neodiprion virginianus TaxID=2961670 RepID=UPI001EE7455A|nr:uncharacterized protein LOC124306727 isoform X1 [Neodiprion virginianus]